MQEWQKNLGQSEATGPIKESRTDVLKNVKWLWVNLLEKFMLNALCVGISD
jgi:hypothetical protein